MPQETNIERLLASYPKPRPPLTPAHQAKYVDEYLRNRSGSGGLSAAVRHLESWMHKKVASHGRHGARILELGAGSLNHVPFEAPAQRYDVVEPFHELLQASQYKERTHGHFDDVFDVPADHRYDRVLSIAVLEHLTELPWVVARSCLLLDNDGHFDAGIPSEGKFLWSLAWRTTTGLAYRIRTGLSYATLMRHEHVNTADDIVGVVSYFFDSAQTLRFPLPWGQLSFYTVIHASGPRTKVAERFLTERPYVRSKPPHEA